MLASHFYESRDGSTGGFFADNTKRSATGVEYGQPSASARPGMERCDMSFGKMNTFVSIVEKTVHAG